MRELLATRRAEGLDFDRAWNRSLREIDWPVKHCRRKNWQEALADTRPEFEAAFNGEATALSDVFDRLRDELARNDRTSPEEHMYVVAAA